MEISYKIMDSSHVQGIYEFSANSFHIPWSLDSIKAELTNKLAKYVVAIDKENNYVAGFAGMWIIAGEGNITNIAVAENYRQQGIGYNLLLELIDLCKNNDCPDLTLEVRVSNKAGLLKTFIRKLALKTKEYVRNTMKIMVKMP